MDEQIEKKNKKLEEDPDDFDTKSSLFTAESQVIESLSVSNAEASLTPGTIGFTAPHVGQ